MMKIYLAAAMVAFTALLMVWASTARAQMIVVPTTADISISDAATSDISFGVAGQTIRRIDWIYIKNDCSTTLYFDLTGKARRSATVANVYPLRLAQNQTFTATVRMSSLGVSPGNGASGCTITVIPARN